MLAFEGKIVVITGTAHDIGQAISIELTAADAIDFLADFQLEPQEATVSNIRYISIMYEKHLE